MKLPITIATMFLYFVCIGISASVSASNNDTLLKLSNWMQGSFNSAKQAETDPDYFNIHLHMTQIWPDRKGAIWLYVEQAAEGYLDKPYRQRVYELKSLGKNKFTSIVYTFPEPEKYAGAWRQENPLANLNPGSLALRKGCAVYLDWDASSGSFKGSTKAKQCESTLRGATYATSEVVITKSGILSWDRGYNANDEQVWGAEKGGYSFLKQP